MPMKNTPFTMKGMSFGNSPLKTHEAGHNPKSSFNTFTRTTTLSSGDQKYLKKKKRKSKVKNIVKNIGEGVTRYVKQVQGKVKPRGWCPKGGSCGGGPKVQKPSLVRRLWPFPSLRKGGSN